MGQLELAETNRQPCASAAQVDCEALLGQKVPGPVHPAGAALQVQAPLGSEPVQLWCVPQLELDDTVLQPSESTTQVDTVPALGQNVPAPVQPGGAALQVQAPLGKAPV